MVKIFSDKHTGFLQTVIWGFPPPVLSVLPALNVSDEQGDVRSEGSPSYEMLTFS